MSTLAPTAEQQAAVDAFGSGGTLVVEAGAGTGKTSMLRMLAESRPGANGLYVAFNKAIQLEAERSFPRSVECRTAHSLAYRSHGSPIRHRLNGPRVTSREAAGILRAPAVALGDNLMLYPSAVATMALRTVERFCHSADEEITARHVYLPPTAPTANLGGLAHTVAAVARRAWDDLCRPDGRLKPSHDVYVKLWQLSHPTLAHDYILFDEAQDADPAVADVVVHQNAQLVAVGDSAQAIFSWRGATDFLTRVDAAHRVQLTQSWRFGPAVATEANLWLDVLGAPLRLTGAPGRRSTLQPVDAPDAVLCRTNGGCVAEVMVAHDHGTPVALVGGGDDIVALAQAAKQLQAGRPAGHPELVGFSCWSDVQHYAEHDHGGSDLAVAVNLIDRHGPDAIVAAIRACVSEPEAELTVSTAHKAKGREWDTVVVASDFRPPKPDPTTGQPGPIPRDDAMLAYVTVTRAMTRLDTGGLAWIHDHPAASADPPAAPASAAGTRPRPYAASTSDAGDRPRPDTTARLSRRPALPIEAARPVAATTDAGDGGARDRIARVGVTDPAVPRRAAATGTVRRFPAERQPARTGRTASHPAAVSAAVAAGRVGAGPADSSRDGADSSRDGLVEL